MNVRTPESVFREAASMAEPVRVPLSATLTVTDPFDAYLSVRKGSGGFFLETTGGQAGHGYFGVQPTEEHTVTRKDVAAGVESLKAMKQFVRDYPLYRDQCDVPYPCGSVGWISYDIARELESLPEHTIDDRKLPRFSVKKYGTMVSWEEPRSGEEIELTITVCPVVDDAPGTVYDDACERAERLGRAIITGEPSMPGDGSADAKLSPEITRSEYERRVRDAIDYLQRGDTFQVVISHRLSGAARIHPTRVYAALRDINPSPYLALLEFSEAQLVSANPQLLFDWRDRHLVTRPIAGTRPRGETVEEDERLLADLRSSKKDLAEHDMLVDLARNDVGRVCERGTVTVEKHASVERYSEVQQLVSTVSGRTRPGVELDDVVAAMFPGGPLTGAPKPRSMEIIEEIEAYRRGPYCGSIGLFGPEQAATFSTTIRTLVYHDDCWYLRVGGGIVLDSDAAEEYEETMHKAQALVRAIDRTLESEATFTLTDDSDNR